MAQSTNKTIETENSVADYLAKISDDAQKQDVEKIIEIFGKITGKPPKIWGNSIIGFDSYQYKYSSGRTGDWFKLGVSARKGNITLYNINQCKSEKTSHLVEKLGKIKTGVGCVYIKKLADIDLDILCQMAQIAYDERSIPQV